MVESATIDLKKSASNNRESIYIAKLIPLLIRLDPTWKPYCQGA